MRLSRKIKTVLWTVFILVLIPALMGLGWTRCEDTSMEPTIRDRDVVVTIDSWSIKPGDVVLFKTPEWKKWPKEDWIWCKRVDHIKGNEYWLVGDNEEESYDSENFGYVHRTNIYKKVLFIIHR